MNDRLLKVVREIFKLDKETIEDEWTSDDIPGWDSVGHLNLILALEKEFDVKFEIEESRSQNR